MATPEAYVEAIIARLRYLIELRDKTIAGVEREMGYGRGYLSDAIRGDKRLTLEMLMRTLAFLQVTPEEFFSGRTPDEARWDPRAYAPGGPYWREIEIAEARDHPNLLRRLEERALIGRDPVLNDLASLLRRMVDLLEEKGLVTAEELEKQLLAEDYAQQQEDPAVESTDEEPAPLSEES